MTVFDYAVLGILGASILLSLMRGFVREALGLASWVVALFLARSYAVTVAHMLPNAIPNESLRMLAGFVIVFLATLLVTSLLTIFVSELVKKMGLSVMDRGLGALFGIARGVLIVGVLVMLGGLTSLPQRPEWRDAMLSAPLEEMVIKVSPWLPQDFTKHLKFDQS
ncbi:MAG TPA: CvpA family protein [Methylophilaceae bacterium]